MFGRGAGPSQDLGFGDEEEKDLSDIKEVYFHKQEGANDQQVVPSGREHGH